MSVILLLVLLLVIVIIFSCRCGRKRKYRKLHHRRNRSSPPPPPCSNECEAPLQPSPPPPTPPSPIQSSSCAGISSPPSCPANLPQLVFSNQTLSNTEDVSISVIFLNVNGLVVPTSTDQIVPPGSIASISIPFTSAAVRFVTTQLPPRTITAFALGSCQSYSFQATGATPSTYMVYQNTKYQMVEWLTAESEKDMHHMKRMRTSREPTSLSSLSQRPPTNFDFGKHWATCIVPILSAESLEIFFDTLYGSVSFRECCPVARLQPDEWGKFLNVLFDFFLQDDARFQLLLLTESEDDRELLRELKEQHDHGVPATKINLPFFWKFLRQKLHYDWPKHKERIGFYALRRDPTWSITFGRCLVDLLFPQEVWQVRRSRRWATLYCSSRHMVFDICMWAEDNRLIDHSCGRPYTSTDPTLGGKQAWEESGECDHTFHDWSRLCVDAQSRVLDYLDLWDLLQYSFSSHSHLNDFGQLVGTRSVMTLEHFDRRSLLSLLRFSPSFQCHTFKLVTCLPASSYKESTHALRLLLQRMKTSLTTLYAPALCSSRLETMHDFMALQNIILHEPCRPLSDLFPLHLRSISIPDDVYPYVPDLAGFRQLHRLCIKVDGVRAWQALIRGIMAMPLLDMAECAFEDTRETRMNLTREENEEFFNGTWTHPKLRVLSLKIYHNDHWGNVGGYLPALEMPGLHHLEVRNAPLVQLSLGGCPNLVVGFSWNRLYFVRSVLPSLDLVKTRWCILNRSPGNLIDLGVRHVSCLHDARLHSVVDPNTNPNPNDSTTVVYHGPSIPFWSELEEQSESEPDTD